MKINLEINANKFNQYGFKVNFEYRPYSAVLFDDKLIVGFSYGDIREKAPNSEFWRAVWCFDRKGDIMWQVEAPYHINNGTGKRVYHDCVDEKGRCVDAIQEVEFKDKKDILVVYGTMGYRLDPETGKLGEIVYQER
jgi:hypothetical protein